VTGELSPWLAALDPDTRQAVLDNVAKAPALTPGQRHQLVELLGKD
jgi:hypothetical protein